MRWLLLRDLHFKKQDLDRVQRTAQWIIAEAKRSQVNRVVICGDLLTSRTMQPTHVLSACYRFISHLSDIVPRVHILLGNHDLAYRRDYQTTALEALNIKRLSPHVLLHSVIDRHEWDGRKVLLLPFREEQSELTEAVATINPADASTTVAFAHLAINKAILQRYTPHTASPIMYRGLTSPDHFAPLARTFTGHFHSHQTITQIRFERNENDLRGSITYLGAPLQLNWGDLNDDKRGIVMFDPQTLKHELLINPYAVGYVAVEAERVLENQVDQDATKDKYVMLLGRPNLLNHVTARDSLLSHGARDVRNWTQTKYLLNANQRPSERLGSSVPISDAAIQPLEKPIETMGAMTTTNDGASGYSLDDQSQFTGLDMIAEARQYVDLLDLDASLSSRRDELVRIGQHITQSSRKVTEEEGESVANHQNFLNKSLQHVRTSASGEPKGIFTNVFVAEPRTLTITNFLGVQHAVTIDFQHDLQRGLTLLVGDNGSGKSTLIEAIVWCQFGRCIRSEMAANDVLNDSIGKNCSVKLEFANGYAITRYRKHKIHKNRVVVTLHDEPQTQLECPDARTTQAAINELLGTDYDTYVRTVVLSHESAASFLNSTRTQRRDLIETSLGLLMLDQWERMSKLLLKSIDAEAVEVRANLEGVTRTMRETERRGEDLERAQNRLENEAAKTVASLEAAKNQETFTNSRQTEQGAHETTVEESNMDRRVRISTLQKRIHTEQEILDQLQISHAEFQRDKRIEPTGWIDTLHEHMRERIEAMTAAQHTGLREIVHRTKVIFVRSLFFVIEKCRFMAGRTETCSSPINDDATKNDLGLEIERRTSRLETLKNEQKRAINHAPTTGENVARSTEAQEALEEFQQQVMIKQREVTIYKHLAEKERDSIQRLQSEHDRLAENLQVIANNRELFEFWSFSLSKRSGASTSPSLSQGKAKAMINFREHILSKSITEINGLLPQILTVLYDDTRHANIASGMLRSIFDTNTVDGMTNKSTSASVLNCKLAVDTSLAYGKRSSGERKRVDLALFFAILQLARANSAHRAQYVLIDEVFDNLDKAGQAAVMKWLNVMSQTVVGWVVVITHSQFLIEQDLGQDSSKVLVVRASMGREGTEMFVNGRRIGRE